MSALANKDSSALNEMIKAEYCGKFTRALIIGGGLPPSAALVHKEYTTGTCIIAADLGAKAAADSGLYPDFMLGDFDSLPQEILEQLKHRCRQCLSFPRDKNFSDLELALEAAAELKITQAVILGVMGGRPDHEIFNVISVLQKCNELGISAELLSDECRVFQLKKESRTWTSAAGRILSVLALDEEVEFSLEGVKWPLKHEILRRSSTRGLSNEVLGRKIQAASHNGRAVLIEIF